MAYDDKTFKATKIFNIEFIEDLNDTLDDITTDVENLEQSLEEEIETLENKIPEKLVYDASYLPVYSTVYGEVGSQETLYYFGFNDQTEAETFFGKTMTELGNLFKNNGSITFNNLLIPFEDIGGNSDTLNAKTLHCSFPHAIDYKEALGETGIKQALDGASSVDTAMNFSSESISTKSGNNFVSRMGLYLINYIENARDTRYSVIFYFIYNPLVDLDVLGRLYDPFPELAPPAYAA